jgi:hypothetical protein
MNYLVVLKELSPPEITSSKLSKYPCLLAFALPKDSLIIEKDLKVKKLPLVNCVLHAISKKFY